MRERDEQKLLDERALQGVRGALYELRPVVEGHNPYALRQSYL